MASSRFDKSNLGSRLRALRDERGLSLRELALRADLAVSFLSKIEAGKASPTIMSLVKILEALRIDVAEFFGSDDRPADTVVFRRADMRALHGKDRTWWYAFPKRRDIKATLAYEEYAPRSQVTEVERHGGDVFGLVLAGALTLEVAGRPAATAETGDAFYIPARTAHVARNNGRQVLKLVVTQLK